MDEADMAQRTEAQLEKVSRYKSQRHTANAEPTGFCLFCGDPVAENRRWCNADCRDDWQTENE